MNNVVKTVWSNQSDKRYIPMATNPGVDTGWQIWDQIEKRWIRDAEVESIDPNEPFHRN